MMMSRRLGNTVMTPTPRWFRPPLGEGYVGNGVTQRWTELTVQAVLSQSDAEVALALRSTLLGAAPHTWGNEAGWLAAKYKASLNKTRKCSPMDTCACVCVCVCVSVSVCVRKGLHTYACVYANMLHLHKHDPCAWSRWLSLISPPHVIVAKVRLLQPKCMLTRDAAPC